MLRTSATALPVVTPEGDAATRRASLSVVVAHDGEGDKKSDELLHLEAVSKDHASDSDGDHDDDDERARREADETNAAYMWSLLLATLAECIYTCFLPDWYILSWNVNATATMINFVGPFMDGMSYAYEELQKTRADTTLTPCLQFRAAFLGVFTSYSYMVDHAGDLSAEHAFGGPLYIVGTVVGACVSFHLGKLLVMVPAVQRMLRLLVTSKTLDKLPSFLLGSNVFIILTIVRAVFGRPGFVQDPKEPRFIGSIRVADGEELILGIFMSCSGILISDYLEDRFRAQPDAQGRVSFLDWGNLICNFVSCWLTCLAYEASKFSPNHIRNNLLVMKFVSCFCGSISNFSAGISHIMLLWHGGNRNGALWNLALHIVTGMVFLPYLRKSEITT